MAKRKIKKFLKKAAPLLAVAGLGKAFMNARNRKAMLEGADANEGFVNMIPMGPFITRKGRDSILADPRINKMDLSEVDLLMKKGGRVKKGFAKKKKQANKMRKK